jgi:hypothetical protein
MLRVELGAQKPLLRLGPINNREFLRAGLGLDRVEELAVQRPGVLVWQLPENAPVVLLRMENTLDSDTVS